MAEFNRPAFSKLDILLQAVGVNIKLGPFNPTIVYLKQSHATMAVPEHDIPAGTYYRAKMELLGMTTDVAFRIDADGVDFAAILDLTELSRVCGGAHQRAVFLLARVRVALRVANARCSKPFTRTSPLPTTRPTPP